MILCDQRTFDGLDCLLEVLCTLAVWRSLRRHRAAILCVLSHPWGPQWGGHCYFLICQYKIRDGRTSTYQFPTYQSQLPESLGVVYLELLQTSVAFWAYAYQEEQTLIFRASRQAQAGYSHHSRIRQRLAVDFWTWVRGALLWRFSSSVF